jgi:hypothetical protein
VVGVCHFNPTYPQPNGLQEQKIKMPQPNTNNPGLVARFLQLLAISSFGIAQPLFDLLSKNPGFMVVHRSQLVDLLALSAVLLFCIPVLFFLIEIVLSLFSTRLSSVAHSIFMALLLTLVALPLCQGISALQGWNSIALSASFSLVVVWAYSRWQAFRSNLALLVLSTPIFMIMFLFNTVQSVTTPTTASSQSPTNIKTDVPIVVLILDELPLASLLDTSGQLDTNLYPNFGRLAGVANWYPQATTISGATLKAVPAILTGCFSDWEQLPNLKDHPRNLFTLLGLSHDCFVQEVQTNLCPTEFIDGPTPTLGLRLSELFSDVLVLYKHIIYPKTMQSHLPPINNRWNNFTGDGIVQSEKPTPITKFQRFQHYIDSIQKKTRPLLAVSHILLPHNPYRFYPDGSIHNWREGEGEDLIGHRWVDDHLVLQHAFKRHLLQLAGTDMLLGKLLDRLEEIDLFDEALIVVTADHGACFTPGQSHRHLTEENVHDIMSVPLFIKFPHQKAGKEIARHVQSVDILPTILDFLALDPGWKMDGVSFLDEDLPDRQILDFLDQDKRVHRQFSVGRIQDTSQTIQWKMSEFSDVGSIEELFAHGAIGPWLGSTIDALPMGDKTDLLLKLNYPERYQEVDLNKVFIPGKITGDLLGWSSRERATLAVAINGVIAGFTQTYFPRNGQEHCSWSFLVPKENFSSGKNEIAVFLVSEDSSSVAFHSLYSEVKLHHGTILGAQATYSVDESGFYKNETWEGTPFRWTNGKATLDIPLGRDNHPQTVQLAFVSTGPQGTNLQISANGSIIFKGHIPRGKWQQTLDLPDNNPDNRVVLEILSDTFISEENRKLGVGISKVLLE